MQEDLETFIYIIETAYAGYEDALARGMDTNILRQKILNHFEGQDVINIEDFAKNCSRLLSHTFRIIMRKLKARIIIMGL